MTSLEIAMQRRQTRAFVGADPSLLALLRTERVRTGSGGYRDVVPAEPNHGPVVARLIPTSDRTPEVKTSYGRMVIPTYVLVAEHDSDIKRWDRFQLGPVTFEVANVKDEFKDLERKYELKADVVVWENA